MGEEGRGPGRVGDVEGVDRPDRGGAGQRHRGVGLMAHGVDGGEGEVDRVRPRGIARDVDQVIAARQRVGNEGTLVNRRDGRLVGRHVLAARDVGDDPARQVARVVAEVMAGRVGDPDVDRRVDRDLQRRRLVVLDDDRQLGDLGVGLGVEGVEPERVRAVQQGPCVEVAGDRAWRRVARKRAGQSVHGERPAAEVEIGGSAGDVDDPAQVGVRRRGGDRDRRRRGVDHGHGRAHGADVAGEVARLPVDGGDTNREEGRCVVADDRVSVDGVGRGRSGDEGLDCGQSRRRAAGHRALYRDRRRHIAQRRRGRVLDVQEADRPARVA